MQMLKVVLPPTHPPTAVILQAQTHFRKAEKLFSLGASTGAASPNGSADPTINRTRIERRI